MPFKVLRWQRGEKPTTEDFEEMFARRNMDYYVFSNEKGYHYDLHRHDYNKFLVLTKGKMKWHIEGEEAVLQAGDAVVLQRDTEHEVDVLEICECWEGHF